MSGGLGVVARPQAGRTFSTRHLPWPWFSVFGFMFGFVCAGKPHFFLSYCGLQEPKGGFVWDVSCVYSTCARASIPSCTPHTRLHLKAPQKMGAAALSQQRQQRRELRFVCAIARRCPPQLRHFLRSARHAWQWWWVHNPSHSVAPTRPLSFSLSFSHAIYIYTTQRAQQQQQQQQPSYWLLRSSKIS